jgi:hypothetical protein
MHESEISQEKEYFELKRITHQYLGDETKSALREKLTA